MLSFDMLGTSGRLSWIRRWAFVFALGQGLLYAALPFAEARVDRPPATAGFESRHSHDCVPLHQPDKCVFCQLATMRARRTDAVAVRAEGRTVLVGGPNGATHEPERLVHRPTLSRAPPSSLA